MKDKVRPDTCLKDAVSAMRWVRKNATMLGIDPERIVSSGGSAGGYLAAAVATIDDFHSEGDDLSVSPKPNAMVLSTRSSISSRWTAPRNSASWVNLP